MGEGDVDHATRVLRGRSCADGEGFEVSQAEGRRLAWSMVQQPARTRVVQAMARASVVGLRAGRVCGANR